jgi:hypothetical protein
MDALDGDLDALRAIRTRQAIVGERLLLAETQFHAWRAQKKSHKDVAFEFRAELMDIPLSIANANWQPGGGAPAGGRVENLQQLWERFGIGVQADWPRHSGRAERTPQAPPDDEPHTVFTRTPELLHLHVVKAEDDSIVEVSHELLAVADSRVPIHQFDLQASVWGENGLTLTFDENGFVSSVGTSTTPGFVAGLEAVAGVTEGFATGVESGTKAYTSVQAARRASMDAELARIKAQVELRQQKLTSAGLDATTGDAVGLQRLQQLQGILEAQTAITAADPEFVTALVGRANGALDWYAQPEPAAPPAPQVVKVVIERPPPSEPPTAG